MENPFTHPLPFPKPLDPHNATDEQIAYTTKWVRTFLLFTVVLMFGFFWLPALFVLGKLGSLWMWPVGCGIAALVIGEWMLRKKSSDFKARL